MEGTHIIVNFASEMCVNSYIDELKGILAEFLGEPASDSDATWVQYNCPCCAAEKGVTSDGKYNLEVSLEHNAYHCWVCGDTMGTRGKLGRLVRQYGGYNIYRRFMKVIEEMRQSELYDINRLGVLQTGIALIDDYEPQLTLPEGFRKLTHSDPGATAAFQYLYSRGLGDDIIEEYGMGYIGADAAPRFRNRIVVPSYNSLDELNYWVGRSYVKGNSKYKYNNPTVPKTSFMFNEGRVNWYETVTLVEGVFDHIVTPNSIPLLGKTLNAGDAVYQILSAKAMADVNIMLDNDAYANAVMIYRLLEQGPLHGRVKLVPMLSDKDASDVFQKEGYRGVVKILRGAYRLNEFDLLY